MPAMSPALSLLTCAVWPSPLRAATSLADAIGGALADLEQTLSDAGVVFITMEHSPGSADGRSTTPALVVPANALRFRVSFGFFVWLLHVLRQCR
jgi:hypothetical protein